MKKHTPSANSYSILVQYDSIFNQEIDKFTYQPVTPSTSIQKLEGPSSVIIGPVGASIVGENRTSRYSNIQKSQRR